MLRGRTLFRTLGRTCNFNRNYVKSYCSTNETPTNNKNGKKITLNITMPSLSCNHLREAFIDIRDNITREKDMPENYKFKLNKYIFAIENKDIFRFRSAIGFVMGFLAGGYLFLVEEYHTSAWEPLLPATFFGVCCGIGGIITLGFTPLFIPGIVGTTVLVTPLYMISKATKKPESSKYRW